MRTRVLLFSMIGMAFSGTRFSYRHDISLLMSFLGRQCLFGKDRTPYTSHRALLEGFRLGWRWSLAKQIHSSSTLHSSWHEVDPFWSSIMLFILVFSLIEGTRISPVERALKKFNNLQMVKSFRMNAKKNSLFTDLPLTIWSIEGCCLSSLSIIWLCSFVSNDQVLPRGRSLRRDPFDKSASCSSSWVAG